MSVRIVLLASLPAYVGISYFTQRSDFLQLLFLFLFLSLAYIWTIGRKETELPSFGFLLAMALLFRLALLGMGPNLSDDYYRFVWDGRLLAHGWNPYLILPKTFITTAQAAPMSLTPELHAHLNSPGYYTVYPPVNQALFAVAAWISPHSLWGNMVILRLFILLAETGTLFLLIRLADRLAISRRHVWWYALNPLVILELTGNLHFEAVMIFFLLLALYLLLKNPQKTYYLAGAAVCLAIAISVKLIPLLFLPILLRWLGWRKGIALCFIVGIGIGLSFSPFLSPQLIERMGSSIDLYFHTFEFNASIYYLVRWLGFQWVGYNIIAVAGTVLSSFVLLGVIWIAWKTSASNSGQLVIACLFALTLYYSLATPGQPWYLTTLVALSVLTPYRYPLVWSLMAVLSYSAYRATVYQENLLLITLEYAFVFGTMIYELVRKKRALILPTHD